MTIRIIYILFFLIAFTVVDATAIPVATVPDVVLEGDDFEEDSIAAKDSIHNVRNKGYWKWALLHGKLNIHDESVQYPKVMGWGIQFIRWFDRTFNCYDTAYVVGTGKPFKIILKNNNWIDAYTGHLTEQHIFIHMNSTLTSNFGGSFSYKGLGLSYMFNLNDLLKGNSIHNARWEFSFTTSRIAADAYLIKDNRSSVYVHNLGKWHGTEEFWGLKRESYGVYAYWFFNNMRYSQSAAYGFSKIQRRSAGTLLVGLHLSRQNVSMDFDYLSDELKNLLPDQEYEYRFRYRDFCALAGYAYNWVFHPSWLFNITAIPSVGYRRTFPTSIEADRSQLSTNIRGKMALVFNHGLFFYGLHVICDGHWYHSSKHTFFNYYNNINLNVGCRF